MWSIFAIVVCGNVGQTSVLDPNFTTFLNALRMTETGGEDQPENAVGDGGMSLGPYQISRAYLSDSGVKGDWRRCRDRTFSEVVMVAYWKRHCPEALRTRDYETLARVHNGGPNGNRKASTLSYWRIVQGMMNTEQIAVRNNGTGARRKG